MYIRVLVHVDMCGLAEAVGCGLWPVGFGLLAVASYKDKDLSLRDVAPSHVAKP